MSNLDESTTMNADKNVFSLAGYILSFLGSNIKVRWCGCLRMIYWLTRTSRLLSPTWDTIVFIIMSLRIMGFLWSLFLCLEISILMPGTQNTLVLAWQWIIKTYNAQQLLNTIGLVISEPRYLIYLHLFYEYCIQMI